MASREKKVVVIGSGVGGAGVAALLQARGHQVTLLERNEFHGGKCWTFSKNGFLVDEGDYRALAEKILFFMDNPQIWAQLSIFGRKHVKDNYDSASLLDEQIRFYEEMLIDGASS